MTERNLLWSGQYKDTHIRIVEVVHPSVLAEGEVILPTLVTRMVEMAKTYDALDNPVWMLTEFDADMLLYFLMAPPAQVEQPSTDIGTAATIAPDRLDSAGMIRPG